MPALFPRKRFSSLFPQKLMEIGWQWNEEEEVGQRKAPGKMGNLLIKTRTFSVINFKLELLVHCSGGQNDLWLKVLRKSLEAYCSYQNGFSVILNNFLFSFFSHPQAKPCIYLREWFWFWSTIRTLSHCFWC